MRWVVGCVVDIPRLDGRVMSFGVCGQRFMKAGKTQFNIWARVIGWAGSETVFGGKRRIDEEKRLRGEGG